MDRIRGNSQEWQTQAACMRNVVMSSSTQLLIYRWESGEHLMEYHDVAILIMLPRFANTDLALARALRLRKPQSTDPIVCQQEEMIDRITSYDCGCQYSIKAVERFEREFPDIAHLVKTMRWAIPAMHIQGHREDCMYIFSTAYMESTGHFHGETAEHYWPEANHLGPQTRQMNRGHRHDTLIDQHNDWNWKKTISLGEDVILWISTIAN